MSGTTGPTAGSGGPEEPLAVDHIDECAEVLDRVYAYVDGELTEHVDEIRAHLEECAPCLAEHDLEVALKALVRRSCQDRAPDALRTRILAQLAQARASLTEVTTTQVTSVRLTGAAGGEHDQIASVTEITEVRVRTEG
jgi:mycothiol system anti-sigma-R factor